MFNWDDYIFVDGETTGLEFREHSLLEFTYAVGLNKPVTLYTPDIKYVLKDADPHALEINRFLDRFESGDEEGCWVEVPDGLGEPSPNGPQRFLNLPGSATQEQFNEFARVVKDKTWVGANPSFDLNFIQEFYWPEKISPHYHLFDVRSWWKGANGSVDMKSKTDVNHFEPLSDEDIAYLEGYLWAPAEIDLVKADHTSLNDVLAMRQAFAFRAWQYAPNVTTGAFIEAARMIF